MSDRVTRLAFLGCGKIARAHAKRLRKHRANVEVHFASRDGARAAAFAKELGGRAYGSYAEAIASPDIDAVAVVTPPASHTELALAAIAARKHVVLEKPPAATSKELGQIGDAATAAGVQVFVAENYQYKPLLLKLRALLAEGVVGDVLFIQVNAIKKQAATHDWRDNPKLALGGALYEGGIHWIDFMASLGLTVRGVRGLRPALPAGAAVERSMLVSFDYAEGAVGTLAYSWEVPSTAKGLRLSKIYGRKGSITFETNGLWVFTHGTKTRLSIPGLRDLAGYNAMWADFVHAWTTDSPPKMTLAQARRDLELVEQAYATAAEVS